MRLSVSLVLLLGAGSALASIEDSKENRLAQTERVLQATPIEETMEDLFREIGAQRQGGEFMALYKERLHELDTSILTETFKDAYSSIFTAEELAYIADSQSSEVRACVRACAAVGRPPMPLDHAGPRTRTHARLTLPKNAWLGLSVRVRRREVA
jgi:hypothetical protein